MPGLTFIYAPHNKNIISEFNSQINNLLFFDNYFIEEYFSSDSVRLVGTRYSSYPIKSYEDDKIKVVIEGNILNRTSLLNTISNFIENVKVSASNISQWLLDTDGDFIIFFYDKANQSVYFFNDAVSRLPIYFYQSENFFLVSREISIFPSILDLKFNRKAFAQHLTFGCPLGENTYWEDVKKIPPATLVRLDLISKNISFLKIHEYNFDYRKYDNLGIKDNAAQLVSIFENTCKNRAKNYDKLRNIISLSGGLDSRCIVAGLKNNNIPFEAISYSDGNTNTIADLEIAKLIAEKMNFNWSVIDVSKSSLSNQLELIKLKMGFNHIGMSFILEFFKSIKSIFGENIIYFTGDGGDQVLPFLGSYQKIKSTDDLVDFIFQNKSIMPVSIVSDLLGINKEILYSDLKEHIEKYPEIDFSNKYARFVLFEKGFNFSVEGEDRNRYFFWSEAPFFSPLLFNYGINCPDNQKRSYRLYRHFLNKLSPELARINNAKWNRSIMSSRNILKLAIQEFYWQSEFHKIKSILNKPLKNRLNNEIELQTQLLDLFNSSDAINEYFSSSKFKTNFKSLNSYSLYNLLTIFQLIKLKS